MPTVIVARGPKAAIRRPEKGEKTAIIRKLTANDVIEETDFAGDAVGLVPVYGIERYTEDKRDVRGAIRAAKDPQRLLNFLGSNFAEAASGQTKAPWIGPRAAFAGNPKWDNANRISYPYLDFETFDENGNPISAPTRNAVDLNLAGYANGMQFMSGMVQASLGQYQASIGGPSRETSRVALDKREQQSDTATYHYNANLGISYEHVGRIILKMIPKMFDVPRMQRVLGEDGEASMVKIDPNSPRAFDQGVGPDGKKIDVLNLNHGEYDIVMSIGPSFTTKREETASILGEIMSRNPQELAIGGDIYYGSLDVPGAQELAKRKKLMLPPQIQQADESSEEVPPQVVGMVQQLQQVMQEREQMLAQGMQAIKEGGEELKKTLADVKGQIANLKVQEAQFDAKVTKVQAEQQMQQMAQQHQAEMQAAQQQGMQAVAQVQGEAQQFVAEQQGQTEESALAALAESVALLAANQAQGNQILLNMAGVRPQPEAPVQ